MTEFYEMFEHIDKDTNLFRKSLDSGITKPVKNINEINFNQIMRKQASIGKLFPTFPSRVRAVAAAGGVTLVEQLPETWHFKVPSSNKSENGVDYDVYCRFVNLEEMINKFAPDRRLWNKAGNFVDYRFLAAEILNAVDIETDCSCLTGDTKIPLLDSRVLTMNEIYNEFGTNNEFWVYSSDENGNFVPKKARCLGITGLTKNLIEVTLDNDKTIKCTYDHKFRMRDGSYKEAKDLKENDSLMPIYFSQTTKKGKNKYQQTYLTVKKNFYTGKKQGSEYKTIHRIVAEVILKSEYDLKYKELIETGKEKRLVVHHKDFNALNNSPENLQWMGVIEHWLYHAKVGKLNSIEGTKRYNQDLRNQEKIHKDRSKAGIIGGNRCKKDKLGWFSNESHHKAVVGRNKTYWSNPENHIKASLKLKGRIISIKGRENMSTAWTDERKKAQSERMSLLNKILVRDKHGANNHKVKSIKFLNLEKTVSVFDLFVEDTHNFALDAGVYVHNCPADLYWGGEYIKTQRKAQYGEKENRPPDIRNPHQYGALCKHAENVFEVLMGLTTTFASFLKRYWAEEIVDAIEMSTKELTGIRRGAEELGKRRASRPVSFGRGGREVPVGVAPQGEEEEIPHGEAGEEIPQGEMGEPGAGEEKPEVPIHRSGKITTKPGTSPKGGTTKGSTKSGTKPVGRGNIGATKPGTKRKS
jgi:Intein splicing domain